MYVPIETNEMKTFQFQIMLRHYFALIFFSKFNNVIVFETIIK